MLRKRPVLWAVVLAAIPLLGWWSYGLFDLDEGFYGAITAEMNRRGEWITPFYNGHPWFEKPILLYWVAKPSMALFGDAIGPRLPSILATLGTYAVVGWFAKRRFGAAAGMLSVITLASCLLVVGVGRMMLTDPLLLLAFTAAFCTFWESLERPTRWRLLTAACLGLGVLAKGPIACILFVPVAAWTWWRERELRPAFKGYWLAGTAILLGVVATWYVPAYLQDGQMFVQKFLVEQNVGRFSGGDRAHTMHGPGGWLYYLPIVLLGFAPWVWFVPRALKRLDPEHVALRRYLVAWATVVFLFFTVAGAKLPHYVLPMAPPLAILVGSDLAARWEGRLTWRRLAMPVAWLLAVAIIAQLAFSAYWRGVTVGATATPRFEVIQDLAKYVRDHAVPGDVVAEYRMGGQHDAGPSHGLKLQETTHPSTLMYLNRDVLETDDWGQIVMQTGRVWVLTRPDRITQKDGEAAAGRLQELDPFYGSSVGPPYRESYRLYILEPKEGPLRAIEG